MTTQHTLLTLPELLDRSRQEIQNRFGSLFLMALIIPAVLWAISYVLVGFNPDIPADYALQHPILTITAVAIQFVLSAWLMTALVLLICKRTNTLKDTFRLAFKKLPHVLGGMFVYIFFIVLVCLLFFGAMFAAGYFLGDSVWVSFINIPLLIILTVLIIASCVYFVLLPYVLILMEMSIWQSILTAFEMVYGHFWHTFRLLLLLVFVNFVFLAVSNLVLALISLVFNFILPGSQFIFSILGFIPSALALLAFHVPLIAWYIDLSLKLWTPEK